MFTHFSQPQCLFHIAAIQEFLLCVDILEDGVDNDTENEIGLWSANDLSSSFQTLFAFSLLNTWLKHSCTGGC